MWENWFDQDITRFPATTPFYHRHPQAFRDHDVILHFVDSEGKTFDLRCGAEHFLGSPWHDPDTNITQSLFKWSDHLEDTGILGMVSFNPIYSPVIDIPLELLLVCHGQAECEPPK